MRPKTEDLIPAYKDSLFAVAFNVCKSAADADDVVQDTFIAYHKGTKEFASDEHVRAWLLRVAVNKAINVTKSFWRRRKVPLDDYIDSLAFETPESKSLLQEVMRLPDKQRVVIHLFYYEDRPVAEIAEILGITENNVKVRLARGRKLLKQNLKEEWEDDE